MALEPAQMHVIPLASLTESVQRHLPSQAEVRAQAPVVNIQFMRIPTPRQRETAGRTPGGALNSPAPQPPEELGARSWRWGTGKTQIAHQGVGPAEVLKASDPAFYDRCPSSPRPVVDATSC